MCDMPDPNAQAPCTQNGINYLHWRLDGSFRRHFRLLARASQLPDYYCLINRKHSVAIWIGRETVSPLLCTFSFQLMLAACCLLLAACCPWRVRSVVHESSVQPPIWLILLHSATIGHLLEMRADTGAEMRQWWGFEWWPGHMPLNGRNSRVVPAPFLCVGSLPIITVPGLSGLELP